MPEVRISGRVRYAGHMNVRYSGPGEPLHGFLAIDAGELTFLVEMHADDAARLARNAARMAEHLRSEEAKRREAARGKA